MSGLTAVMALKALDGLTERAAVTSENIANANTPGYRPLKVSFEDSLGAASERGAGAVNAVQVKVERDTDAAEASGVRLDLQMATASMTTARYAALIQILTLQMQQTRTALGTS
ncbi:flagellar basal body rod protein FlgB [Asticcacaulis solisilvae]|uniref:flagellar basal body rod protein FlgB n=1 Tax=Asticcacaulis solisilvae TaxID=1217274 RepID=UPI003FD6EB36